MSSLSKKEYRTPPLMVKEATSTRSTLVLFVRDYVRVANLFYNNRSLLPSNPGHTLKFACCCLTDAVQDGVAVIGDLLRIVLATFIGYSDDEEVLVWAV